MSVPVVVEFAASVAPFGQSPALRADGAAVAPLAEGTGFACGLRIHQEREETLAVERLRRRQPCEVAEGVKEIE